MKRYQRIWLIAMIVGMSLMLLTGCSSNGTPEQTASETAEPTGTLNPTAAPTPSATPTPTPTPTTDLSLFDETCWIWCVGVTSGSMYYAQFHKNGTLDCICATDLAANTIIRADYTYENGKLYMDGTPVRAEQMQYHKLADNSFESDQEVSRQAGYSTMTLRPDPDQRFLNRQKEVREMTEILKSGVWFTCDSMNLSSSRITFQSSESASIASVIFEQDEDYHAIGYRTDTPRQFSVSVLEKYAVMIDESGVAWTYSPEYDALYHQYYQDTSGVYLTEYIMHFQSDPDVESFFTNYKYFTSMDMMQKTFD